MTFYIEKELYGEQTRAEGAFQATISSIRNLMETMNWTAQQAMQALKIPASEYDKYLAMI